jgi:class 3 adenylate cyclase
MTRSHDYPCGYAAEETERLKGYIRKAWGKGASLRAIAPSQQSDPLFASWVAFAEQEGCSPGAALDLLEMNLQLDLRELLPAIRVPTVVLQAADDKMMHPGSGPYLAERIPNARYVESPGDDHVFFLSAQHHIVEAVRWMLSRPPAALEEDRFLSTALAARAHGEVDLAAWHSEVQRFRGRAVPGAMQACFDGPIRALHCGAAVAEHLDLSCGVHAGEVLRVGAVPGGPAFEMAQTLAARAPRGQVWASHVVLDLVPGADIVFAETGQHVDAQGRQTTLFSVQRKR